MGGKGGGVTHAMHGRDGLATEPRNPTLPGRSTSGFHRLGRQCFHQARSSVRRSVTRMKGELRPSKNRLCGGTLSTRVGRTGLIYFSVWPLPEKTRGVLCDCLVGTLPYTLIR